MLWEPKNIALNDRVVDEYRIGHNFEEKRLG
jgi:hypothetical protein